MFKDLMENMVIINRWYILVEKGNFKKEVIGNFRNKNYSN